MRFPPEQVNFADQDLNFAKILYSQDSLKVFLSNERMSQESRQTPRFRSPS